MANPVVSLFTLVTLGYVQLKTSKCVSALILSCRRRVLTVPNANFTHKTSLCELLLIHSPRLTHQRGRHSTSRWRKYINFLSYYSRATLHTREQANIQQASVSSAAMQRLTFGPWNWAKKKKQQMGGLWSCSIAAPLAQHRPLVDCTDTEGETNHATSDKMPLFTWEGRKIQAWHAWSHERRLLPRIEFICSFVLLHQLSLKIIIIKKTNSDLRAVLCRPISFSLDCQINRLSRINQRIFLVDNGQQQQQLWD